MRVLTPVIEITALAVLHARQDLALRGPVAFEFIRDDHPWYVLQPFEESLNLRQSVGESPRPPLLQNRA
jgi:hypothetical protein